MSSKLAKEDLDDLRAEGLKPSDEDVIRLHALAARISDGPETTAYNLPRFGIAGDVVFWEPTMAALFWYAYAKRFAGDVATMDWLFAFACAHGRERGYLSGLRDPQEIERALGRFLGELTATKAEVENAVYFAAVGQEIVPEKTEIAKQREKKLTPSEREQRNYAVLEERLTQAAAATGLTYDDIMVQTPSRLKRMIYAAHVQAGMELTQTTAKAHAEYLATLNAITKRLREEKSAAENKPPPGE